MAVLLEMQAREVELFVGLHLTGQQGSLGTIGNGTNLIGLGMPAEHGALAVDEGFHDVEGKLVEASTLHVDGLCQHMLGRECYLLFIIHLAVIIAKNNADILL